MIPFVTDAFLTKVCLFVHQAPPLASVYPAVASSVQALPGSYPTFPKISIIFPPFSSVIASSPLK